MSEDIKVKCGLCKHRLPKEICGCPESPYYNQRIDMSGSCDFFEHNPAQSLYSSALARCVLISGDEELRAELETEVLKDLETAIELGLCEDDEVYAKFTWGQHHLTRTYQQSSGDIDDPELSRGAEHMEQAVLMDSKGGYGVFSEPVHTAELRYLGAAYVLFSSSIKERDDLDSAIAYLEEKLHVFDYLPTPPLVMLQTIGEMYADNGDPQSKQQIATRILETPVSSFDSEAETRARRWAEGQLQALNSPNKKQSGCFIATAVYGEGDSQEIKTLCYFRDNFLMTRPMGKLFVSFYYAVSPSVAKVLKRSEASRKLVIRFLLRPVLTMVKHTIRKTNKSSRTLLEEDSVRRLDAPISEMIIDRKGG